MIDTEAHRGMEKRFEGQEKVKTLFKILDGQVFETAEQFNRACGQLNEAIRQYTAQFSLEAKRDRDGVAKIDAEPVEIVTVVVAGKKYKAPLSFDIRTQSYIEVNSLFLAEE